MDKLKGRLFLIPSPIDEEDGFAAISPEVIRVIHSLDYFIVEKLRTARRYISATKPSRPVNEMMIEEMMGNDNDLNAIEKFLAPAVHGKDIGLMSEAGLPAIADPGGMYVKVAHKLGIEVIPLAGPSSIMMALMASGLEGQRFSFHGYLSAKKDELAAQMKELEKRADRDNATQIWIETPYRNHQILTAAENSFGKQRSFCIAAGLGMKDGFVRTKDMTGWKKNGWPEIHKIPAVFLMR